jgi:hypothetical protein
MNRLNARLAHVEARLQCQIHHVTLTCPMCEGRPSTSLSDEERLARIMVLLARARQRKALAEDGDATRE